MREDYLINNILSPFRYLLKVNSRMRKGTPMKRNNEVIEIHRKFSRLMLFSLVLKSKDLNREIRYTFFSRGSRTCVIFTILLQLLIHFFHFSEFVDLWRKQQASIFSYPLKMTVCSVLSASS